MGKQARYTACVPQHVKQARYTGRPPQHVKQAPGTASPPDHFKCVNQTRAFEALHLCTLVARLVGFAMYMYNVHVQSCTCTCIGIPGISAVCSVTFDRPCLVVR